MDIKRLKQEVLEDTYSRTNNHERVIKEINTTPEIMDLIYGVIEESCDWLQTDAGYQSLNNIKESIKGAVLPEGEILEDLIVSMLAITIFDNTPKTIQQVVGVGLNRVVDYLQDPFDAAKFAAEILGIMCEHDLVDITTASAGDTEYTMVSSQYELSVDVINKIHQTKYMPPMICKPVRVTKNKDYSYLTFKSNMILGDSNNQHKNKISLDVINIQNAIPLELDLDVLKTEETSSKPLDTPEKILNFNRMKDASREVYNMILAEGNTFYNTHAYDMRGRLYSNGYYVHVQSTEYKRSLINFKHKEVISDVLED